MKNEGVGPLQGTLVIDLLPRIYGMTGRILSDLGASVVRVDLPAEAIEARWDARWREGSWTWDFGKRVIEPDVGELEGLLDQAAIVLRLADWPATAPAVPRAVDVVVSPFGQGVPRADWVASDLGVAASSGNLWATGDPDRPPVACSAPLSLVHGCPEMAAAAVFGLARGPGRVDVSLSEAYTQACLGGIGNLGWKGDRGKRQGASIGATKEIWPCADGWVSFGLRGGKARQPSLQRLAQLAAERGDNRLDGVDWSTYLPSEADPGLLATMTNVFGALFGSLTLRELDRLSAEDHVLVAPILDATAIRASSQLVARQFFKGGAHAAIPRSVAAARRRGEEWSWLGPPDVATKLETGTTDLDRPGPWHGTRIIEFGAGVAGPLVGRYFAEHGATVIRIESTSRPDFLRVYALGPSNPHGLEGSSLFVWTNAGKFGVTLNLKLDDALALARRLIRDAHAVIENFTPGTMERIGLGYDELQKNNPSLVLLSLSFRGQSGPQRSDAGFGALGSALSGFNYLTGWPDREPVGPANTITDSLAPRFGAATLAAALVAQRKGAVGQHYDVAQLETTIYTLSPWLAWCSSGRPWEREGNRSPYAVPHGVFRSAGDDRWVAIAAWSSDEWRRLREIIGWEGNDLEELGDRVAAVEDIEAAVEAWTSVRRADDAAADLQAVGVEAVPVADYVDLVADPTLLARGHVVPLDHEVLGPMATERVGFRLNPDMAGYDRPAPFLGRDNRHILQELLGLEPDLFDRYVADGVIY